MADSSPVEDSEDDALSSADVGGAVEILITCMGGSAVSVSEAS